MSLFDLDQKGVNPATADISPVVDNSLSVAIEGGAALVEGALDVRDQMLLSDFQAGLSSVDGVGAGEDIDSLSIDQQISALSQKLHQKGEVVDIHDPFEHKSAKQFVGYTSDDTRQLEGALETLKKKRTAIAQGRYRNKLAAESDMAAYARQFAASNPHLASTIKEYYKLATGRGTGVGSLTKQLEFDEDYRLLKAEQQMRDKFIEAGGDPQDPAAEANWRRNEARAMRLKNDITFASNEMEINFHDTMIKSRALIDVSIQNVLQPLAKQLHASVVKGDINGARTLVSSRLASLAAGIKQQAQSLLDSQGLRNTEVGTRFLTDVTSYVTDQITSVTKALSERPDAAEQILKDLELQSKFRYPRATDPALQRMYAGAGTGIAGVLLNMGKDKKLGGAAAGIDANLIGKYVEEQTAYFDWKEKVLADNQNVYADFNASQIMASLPLPLKNAIDKGMMVGATKNKPEGKPSPELGTLYSNTLREAMKLPEHAERPMELLQGHISKEGGKVGKRQEFRDAAWNEVISPFVVPNITKLRQQMEEDSVAGVKLAIIETSDGKLAVGREVSKGVFEPANRLLSPNLTNYLDNVNNALAFLEKNRWTDKHTQLINSVKPTGATNRSMFDFRYGIPEAVSNAADEFDMDTPPQKQRVGDAIVSTLGEVALATSSAIDKLPKEGAIFTQRPDRERIQMSTNPKNTMDNDDPLPPPKIEQWEAEDDGSNAVRVK